MKRVLMIIFLSVLTTVIAKAQWSIDSLTSPASSLYAGSTTSKVVFTNGGEWNVFDVNTHAHSSGLLAVSRSLVEVVNYGEKVYVGGGKYGSFADPVYTKYVDVYNATTNTWSVLNLSKAREVGGAGALGNKIVFAGGSGRDFGGPVYLYNKVDIFDATTGARTTGKISKARSNISVGAAGNKIVFAGGWYWDMMYNVLQSNVADIYDVSTNTWSKATLSKKRESMGVAVIGDKIIFAGGVGGAMGGAVNNVDVYNTSTNTWTTSILPAARYGMISAVTGTKAYFGGGIGGAANAIYVYDALANSWSTLIMPVTLSNYSMTAINGKIYFAGGYDAAGGVYSNLVQVYDPVANAWSNEYLSQARSNICATTVGGTGIFAGGIKAPAYPTTYSNRVDFFIAPLRTAFEEINTNSDLFELSVFPNPAINNLQILINNENILPARCFVYDRLGQIVMNFVLYEKSALIQVGELPVGTYIISVAGRTGTDQVKTFIKN